MINVLNMSKHILIVEDDPNTLFGLCELLQQEGHQVRGISRGKTALKIIRKGSWDIVLCDDNLPDIDGLTLCCMLKSLRPKLAVCVITAQDNLETIEQAQQCGIARVFKKPLALNDLLAMLDAK